MIITMLLSGLLLFFPCLETFAGTGCNSSNGCHIGSAGFSTMDSSEWYVIDTFSYPTATTLSLNRNNGFTQGNVHLTDTGLIIGQSGNYSVSITAILQNNEPDPILIPMFLVEDGVFDPSNPTNLGSVGVLLPGEVVAIQSTSVLPYVPSGTALSLIATNGGSPGSVPVTVIGWGISVFRISCDPTP